MPEAPTIAAATARRIAPFADALYSRGVATARGGSWHASNVYTFAMQNYSRITREPDCFERQRLRLEYQSATRISSPIETGGAGGRYRADFEK
jgi:hypothetical protein